jgi:hypothetical protein
MHGTLNNATSARPIGSRDATKARTDYRAKELVWDGLTLRLGTRRRRRLATVEPDSKWPGMYRVRHDGNVTDMVNLTRAKDAAISIALSQLNAAKEAE